MAAKTNYHKLGWLKTAETNCPTALEVRCPNQGVNRAVCYLKVLGKVLSLPLPSVKWLLAIFVTLWLVDASLWRLPPLSYGILPVSVSRFPSSNKDTSQWTRIRPNLIWPHLKLITSGKTLFPNKVTFIGTWILTYLLGGHNSTHNRRHKYVFTSPLGV